MTLPYDIKNTSGTIVSRILPNESNGLSNRSIPRQILDVVYNSALFTPAVDCIVVADDLTSRFTQGFQFDVIDSGYAGTYTVSLTGHQSGDTVALYANGNTYIPVSGGVHSPAFTIVGIEPGANGRVRLQGVANGRYTFLPTQSFEIQNNSFPAANDTYSVQSAETSNTYTLVSVDSTLQTVTLFGDVTRFFTPSVQFFLRGSLAGTADLTYTVGSSTVDGSGNTVITVSNAVAIPVGTVSNIQMTVTLKTPVTIVTVTGSIPLGAGADGEVVITSLTALPFTAPTTITSTASPAVSTVVYNIADDYTSVFLNGAPLLIRKVLIGGVRRDLVVTVVSTSFAAPTIAYPNGVTSVVTQFTNASAVLPEIITDGLSTLVFPVLNLINGYLQYTNPFVDTSLHLIGRGASTFNDSTSWGQALLENSVHIAENFANTNPPAAPLQGQLWFDQLSPALRLKTSTTYPVVAVSTGNSGAQGWSIDGNNVATTGDTIVVYNNAGYALAPTKFTVTSSTTTATPFTSSGYTTQVVVAEDVVAGASAERPLATAKYGQMYNLSSMKGVIVSGLPAIGDVDMGGHRVTNAGDPTNNQDLVTRSYGDTRYVNATGDTMTGALTMQTSDIDVIDGTVNMTASSSIVFDSLGSGNVHVNGSGSITVASGSITAGSVSTNQVQLANNGASAPTLTFTTTSASTATGNAVINLGTNKIVNAASPTSAADVATKQYVDDRVNGIMWLTPILDPNLFDDSLSAPPVVAGGDVTIPYHRTYIVKSPGTGAWAGFDGHAMYHNGTTWISVLGRAVQVGDRFGVFIEPDDEDLMSSLPAGAVIGQGGKIATVTAIGTMAYTFYTPAEPDAVSVKGTSTGSSPHYGHSYTFRGAWGTGTYGTNYRWIEFAGPQMLVDGAGLLYTGNILNIGQGTGITVAADSIALNTTYTDSVYVRRNGSAMTGSLAMGNNSITGLADAVNPQDAVNQRAGDARYLTLSGGTMTGNLTLNGDPGVPLQAATKQYVDNNITTLSNAKVSKNGDTMTGLLVLSGDPSALLGAATKQYVDAADALRLLKTGGTMSGALTLAADPASALQAATKQYVDNNTVSKTVSTTMSAGINVTFVTGGEILGLPVTPTTAGSATSKSYVDTQVATRASDTLVVHLAGTETITGAKTFNNAVTVAADGAATNLLISSTNFTVSGKIASSGAAYAIAMTAGQNNAGVGGTLSLAAGQGSTTGGGLSINGGAGAATGGNVTITSGTGSSTTQNGSVTFTAGNASLGLDPRGVWTIGSLAPTATRQAIVSDPSAPTTASPKWTSVATRVAAAPVSSASAGVLGDWFSDDNFFYVYGTTGWRRVAVSTF